MPYYITIGGLVFFVFLARVKNSNSLNTFLTSTSLLLLVTLAVLRGDVGTDYSTYIEIWKSLKPISVALFEGTGKEYLEPGFRYFFSSLKQFTDSDRVFLAAISLLNLVPLFVGLVKLDRKIVLPGILLYFLFFYLPYTLNAMRQAIAMSFLILSLPYLLSGRIFKVVICGLIGSSFHYSGFFIFLGLGFNYIRIDSNLMLIVSSVVGLISYVLKIPHFILFDLLEYKVKFVEHFLSDTSVTQIATRLFMVAVVFFILFNLKRVNALPLYKSYALIMNIYLVGFTFYLAFLDINMFATRINMFFRVLEVVLIPTGFFCFKYRMNRLLVCSVYLLALLAFYSASSGQDYHYEFFKT
ncbi:EpsG family protein [Zooshikella ganghwensis]|uniref:EpsG family protein n=1 Tax=Zooshikella ganghwensis TaxID=202772 RepID=A0A4P9VML3_9GAMM|nr:EpsG family protein [Zooshikella ganghwensis]RDH43162.1 EpsG family protein [Zooshikella ganghwensis]